MNAIILMLFMSLGGNEVATNNAKETELISALESEKTLFASIEEITAPQIHIIDLLNDDSKDFHLSDLIEGNLSIDDTIEFEKADLMFEYQGDLFYLKG